MQTAELGMMDNPFVSDDLQTLTLDESEQVGGGMWPLVIGIAIGCALLLAHD